MVSGEASVINKCVTLVQLTHCLLQVVGYHHFSVIPSFRISDTVFPQIRTQLIFTEVLAYETGRFALRPSLDEERRPHVHTFKTSRAPTNLNF